MAPIWLSWPATLLYSRELNMENPVTITDYLVAQWRNPGDILSILLLLGPDIVQRAIAQLAGRTITPVAFSFGWVAYAVGALLSTIGGPLPLLPLHGVSLLTWPYKYRRSPHAEQ